MTTHERTSRSCHIACLLALVLTSLVCAAGKSDAAKPATTEELGGLSYVETLTAGADEGSELPMLIALHYMTGSPATSIADYGGLDIPVRLLSLEGPHQLEGGYSWFPDGYYDLDAASAA